MSQKPKTNWFTVDREGLRELHGNVPPERLVLELIQNAWDESSTVCDVTIIPTEIRGRRVTAVTVMDDNPDGFKNLADAYTLFRSTPKRTDPTKRGRFNFGEKIVLSRAIHARISSTTGEIRFDRSGRHSSRNRRAAGTEVEVVFPRWKPAEEEQALTFLRRLIAPSSIQFLLNGTLLKPRTAEIVREATLPTEILRADEGVTSMSRTQRKTSISLYPMFGPVAYLYEMGIPVCEISGNYDVSVAQKIPLASDRETVSPQFIQDVYAEVVIALGEKLDVSQFGEEAVQLALADARVDPTTAKDVFGRIYGPTAAIQSHDADSDQEAVRHGFTLVPSRTWGRDVNSKLREAGVPTTHSLFGRDQAREQARIIPPSTYTDAQRNFVAFVQMLAREHYSDTSFAVALGRWERSRAAAFNQDRTYLVFHVDRVSIEHPVSKPSIILHELAHCKGSGHDSVYDTEFERLVDLNSALLARHPKLFRPFEPACFAP